MDEIELKTQIQKIAKANGVVAKKSELSEDFWTSRSVTEMNSQGYPDKCYNAVLHALKCSGKMLSPRERQEIVSVMQIWEKLMYPENVTKTNLDNYDRELNKIMDKKPMKIKNDYADAIVNDIDETLEAISILKQSNIKDDLKARYEVVEQSLLANKEALKSIVNRGSTDSLKFANEIKDNLLIVRDRLIKKISVNPKMIQNINDNVKEWSLLGVREGKASKVELEALSDELKDFIWCEYNEIERNEITERIKDKIQERDVKIAEQRQIIEKINLEKAEILKKLKNGEIVEKDAVKKAEVLMKENNKALERIKAFSNNPIINMQETFMAAVNNNIEYSESLNCGYMTLRAVLDNVDYSKILDLGNMSGNFDDAVPYVTTAIEKLQENAIVAKQTAIQMKQKWVENQSVINQVYNKLTNELDNKNEELDNKLEEPSIVEPLKEKENSKAILDFLYDGQNNTADSEKIEEKELTDEEKIENELAGFMKNTNNNGSND